MKKSLFTKLLTVLFFFVITSYVTDKSEEFVWVEFCNHGVTGVCLLKQGGGLGWRCYTASIQDPKDCNGFRWEDI